MTDSNNRYGSYTGPNGDHSVKATASAMTEAAGEQLADVAGQAQHVAQEQLDNLTAAIRRKPIQAASIAAGIGFALAMIARR
jgi:ElaB/YqjD/DUF883 family membrane-anchored ribosome-binding protein